MSPNRAAYASMQARLQARHGGRPDHSDWRRLESSDDLAAYLQLARRSPLRQWVLGLHDSFTQHELELALKLHFRHYVSEVSNWLPGAAWQRSVTFCSQLIELPALALLLDGQPAPLWLNDDPLLGSFAEATLAARREAIQQSEFKWLLLDDNQALTDRWLKHWQTLWPEDPASQQGLQSLIRLLEEYRKRAPAASAEPTLRKALTTAFRHEAFKPGAAIAHLALVALDLERLRGGLAMRALFPGLREVQA